MGHHDKMNEAKRVASDPKSESCILYDFFFYPFKMNKDINIAQNENCLRPVFYEMPM